MGETSASGQAVCQWGVVLPSLGFSEEADRGYKLNGKTRINLEAEEGLIPTTHLRDKLRNSLSAYKYDPKM